MRLQCAQDFFVPDPARHFLRADCVEPPHVAKKLIVRAIPVIIDRDAETESETELERCRP
jgi:hypothetical protein